MAPQGPRSRVRVRSFPAVAGRRPKVLILGTLPGIESLRLTQYYGHPRNKFWELLGAALEEDLRSLSYAQRLERVKARGVALWDIVSSARRRGSLDAAIRGERHNEVAALVQRLKIKAMFFNGQAAQKMFLRKFGAPPIPSFLLPSSSPAYASMTLNSKARAWRRVRAFL